MSLPDRERLRALAKRYVPFIVALLAAGGVTVAVTSSDDDHDGHVDHTTVAITTPHGSATVRLGGPGKKTVTLTPAAQTIAAQQKAEDASGNDQAAHSDLKDTAPQTPAQVKAAEVAAPDGQPTSPAHIPLAAVSEPGCRTLPVRNYSLRTGAPTDLFVLHQTVSADNGWAGVLGNVSWFNNPLAQASSNFIVARTGGQCAYVVPVAYKAWAQAQFNRVAVSVEVTETGREGTYLTPGTAGWNRVRQLMIHVGHGIYRIPYQHGRVSQATCSVVKPGFVEHADLGVCGGGHHDDDPYSIDPLIASAKAADPTAKPITATDRTTCRKLNWWRAHGRPHGKAEANAVRRRKALTSRGVACTARGPARA